MARRAETCRGGRARAGSRATTIALYILAALAEIAGCFAVWAWAREGKSALWLVPGALSLALFAFLLTRIDTAFAGRAFAAHGGV